LLRASRQWAISEPRKLLQLVGRLDARRDQTALDDPRLHL
jgi:hypothetical protein